ncbi:hypothetical protein DFH27DRAFT_615624 [Peziza echinospora]|nr:hypothetical protein DFH27DRAFT_615624 [Peziza echinospora]
MIITASGGHLEVVEGVDGVGAGQGEVTESGKDNLEFILPGTAKEEGEPERSGRSGRQKRRRAGGHQSDGHQSDGGDGGGRGGGNGSDRHQSKGSGGKCSGQRGVNDDADDHPGFGFDDDDDDFANRLFSLSPSPDNILSSTSATSVPSDGNLDTDTDHGAPYRAPPPAKGGRLPTSTAELLEGLQQLNLAPRQMSEWTPTPPPSPRRPPAAASPPSPPTPTPLPSPSTSTSAPIPLPPPHHQRQLQLQLQPRLHHHHHTTPPQPSPPTSSSPPPS